MTRKENLNRTVGLSRQPQFALRILYSNALIWLLPLAGVWCFVAVGAVVWLGVTGIIIAVLPMTVLLIVSQAWARVVVVVGGAIFVFGSSSDVSSAKIVYAGVLILCAAISGIRLMRGAPSWMTAFKSVVFPGVLFAGVMVVSTLATSGADPSTFLRQAVFYIMLLLAPIIALDVGLDLKPKSLSILIWVAGAIAAVSFATDWLARRGVSSLPIGKFALSSLLLPAFAFSLALVHSALGRGLLRKIGWIVLMVLIPLAMLVTGTRTNLIIFVALIATIGSAKNLAVPIHRMLVNIAVLVGAGVVLFPVAASFAISDNAFLASRVQAFLNVVQGRALDDQSFFGRYEQYDTAMQLIGAHPVFGLTLGTQLDYSLDTPLLTVVHLGVLGTALLLLFVIAIIIAVVRVSRAGHPTAAYTAFKGLMLVALCNVPFGTPFEDRGFGLAVLLALTTMASEIAHPDLAARAFTRDVRRRPNMYAGSAEGLPGVAG